MATDTPSLFTDLKSSLVEALLQLGPRFTSVRQKDTSGDIRKSLSLSWTEKEAVTMSVHAHSCCCWLAAEVTNCCCFLNSGPFCATTQSFVGQISLFGSYL